MTSRYEDALWDEIVANHHDELSDLRIPAAPRRRPKAVAGATMLTVAGAGVALIAISVSSTTAPAYAVTRNPNGSVSVTLRQLSAINDVNARLKALGVRAVVTRTGSRCSSVPTDIVRVSPLRAPGTSSSNRRITQTIVRAGSVQTGAVHVLIASRSADGRIALIQGQSNAAMPACVREIRILAGGHIQIIGSGTPRSSGPVQTPVPGTSSGSATSTSSESSRTPAGTTTS